jgi:hypothetical protein
VAPRRLTIDRGDTTTLRMRKRIRQLRPTIREANPRHRPAIHEETDQRPTDRKLTVQNRMGRGLTGQELPRPSAPALRRTRRRTKHLRTAGLDGEDRRGTRRDARALRRTRQPVTRLPLIKLPRTKRRLTNHLLVADLDAALRRIRQHTPARRMMQQGRLLRLLQPLIQGACMADLEDVARLRTLRCVRVFRPRRRQTMRRLRMWRRRTGRDDAGHRRNLWVSLRVGLEADRQAISQGSLGR